MPQQVPTVSSTSNTNNIKSFNEFNTLSELNKDDDVEEDLDFDLVEWIVLLL